MTDYTDTLALFPGALSTAATNMAQHATGDTVQADHMNQAQAEIVKIEAALGTNPQGISGTVAARLAAIESTGSTNSGHAGLTTGVHGVGGGNVVGTTLAQTLTNKTLDSPTLTGTVHGSPTFDGNITFSGGISLGGGAQASGFGVPAGTVVMSLGAGTPVGWLPLDGTFVTPITNANYPALWTALGGTGSYVLPDISDRVPVGQSGTKAIGATGGADTTTLSSANLPQHAHDITHGHTLSVDAGGVHEHSGQYQSFGISVRNGGYDLVRPFSQDNYSTQGNASTAGHSTAPIVTYTGGLHYHTGSVSTYSGNSGNAGSASPTPVSVVPKSLAFRFLIKT